MSLRMVHPHIDGEATAANEAQYRGLYEARGWELVPDGTPLPGEPGYQPHVARPAAPNSDELDIVPDESTEKAASKPPRSRRSAADQPPSDAATNPED